MNATVTSMRPQVVERMRECIQAYIKSCPSGSADPLRLRQVTFLCTEDANNEAWMIARTIARPLANGRIVLR